MEEMGEADEARAAPHPGDLDSKLFQLKEELNSPGLKREKGHSRQRDSMSNSLEAKESAQGCIPKHLLGRPD